MAEFTPKKIVLGDINNGIEFTESDGVTPNAINDPIEAVAYSQTVVEHLTDTPDTSEIDGVGSPNVSFISSTTADGVTIYKFKFSNLSGATFTPSLDEAGNLSWSNNRNLPNPPTINISGRDYLFSSEVLSGNYIPQVNSEVTDIPLTSFNRAPVDDIDHCYLFYYYTPENIYYWLATQVVDIQETTATLKILSVVRLTGYTPTIGKNGNWVINGEDTGKPSYGASGVTDVVAGASYNQDDFTITPLTFNFEVGNSKTVNVKAAVGNVEDGSYAKLAQVVRVDTAQSLTDEQKTQAQNNMGLDNKYAKQNGTYPNLTAGSADEATKLATARNMQVNLASGNSQSFDGSADATEIGVKGILPVGNGGTGATSLDNITVGRAKADGSGNNIESTYAKLSQVVRTDSKQSLSVDQQRQALQNIGRPCVEGYSTQKEWLHVARLSFEGQYVSGGGYNTVFLVGESNGYDALGLLQVSGETAEGTGFYTMYLKYIDFSGGGTILFSAASIIGVMATSTVDIYIRQPSKNYIITGLQVLANFGAQKPSITLMSTAADRPSGGAAATEFVVNAGIIYSKGSRVFNGVTLPNGIASGTVGSLTLPGSGWYVLYANYQYTGLICWVNSGSVVSYPSGNSGGGFIVNASGVITSAPGNTVTYYRFL